jgi:hypothetical protein
MNLELFKEDPRTFEDWEDLELWKKASDFVFNLALQAYFKNRMAKVPDTYLLECLTNKVYCEVSDIPSFFKKEQFIDNTYEICGLFLNNKDKERFFILKKDNVYYGLDIAKEYAFLVEKPIDLKIDKVTLESDYTDIVEAGFSGSLEDYKLYLKTYGKDKTNNNSNIGEKEIW